MSFFTGHALPWLAAAQLAPPFRPASEREIRLGAATYRAISAVERAVSAGRDLLTARRRLNAPNLLRSPRARCSV